MTTFTDNPQLPGVTNDTYTPDQLIAGSFDRITEQSAIITGGAKLLRGTVLGLVLLGAASSAAKAGGNTGNGTLVLDVTTPILANAEVGVYSVRCIQAVTNGGVFEVKNPAGRSLGEAIIVAGAGGTITFADQVKFVLTDGATDFIVGDGFDITIAAAAAGTYKKSVKTAVDGSAAACAVLADTADASGGDVGGAVYLTGEFNSAKLIMDASWTAAALKPVLRPLGIFLRTAVTADAAS